MSGLYDLHTHSLLSDGEMLPLELIRRMAVLGYTTVAITDHVDPSNITSVVQSILEVPGLQSSLESPCSAVLKLPMYTRRRSQTWQRTAKNPGADIVVVHGETPVRAGCSRNKPCSMRMQIRKRPCPSGYHHY